MRLGENRHYGSGVVEAGEEVSVYGAIERDETADWGERDLVVTGGDQFVFSDRSEAELSRGVALLSAVIYLFGGIFLLAGPTLAAIPWVA